MDPRHLVAAHVAPALPLLGREAAQARLRVLILQELLALGALPALRHGAVSRVIVQVLATCVVLGTLYWQHV